MTQTSFEERFDLALNDPNVGHGLLAFQRDWRVARDAQMVELEEIAGLPFATLASNLATVKSETRDHWPELTEMFEARAVASGATIHHAATAADAQRVIIDILNSVHVTEVVKTKSMVTEEIFLNDHLEAAGISVIETDLGEWLLQLVGEHPSHLVLPAIHKRRHQIAQIMEDALGRPFDPDDVLAMVRAARGELRQSFFAAGAGITGANALVASTGGVLLVTNEGNATLTTTIPETQIVVAGLDKLVPNIAAVVDQIRLLARSATGQRITSYTSMINGPHPGQTLHVVLVDNGRSEMAVDGIFADALACIRCGACADVCPPYQVVGGHVFGHVYTGAIGLVNTPFHHELEDIAEAQSLCVSCNACATVCPANIPLPSQILRTRSRVFESSASPLKRLVLTLFRSRWLFAIGMTAAALLSAPFARGGFLRVKPPKRHRWRSIPAIPIVPARWRRIDREPTGAAPETYESEVTGKSVAIFLQCVTDRMAPEFAEATADLIRRSGADVVVPRSQHCCGLPAFDSGDWDGARKMLESMLDDLDGYEFVVTPGTSCLIAVTEEYGAITETDADLQARVDDLANRLYDVVSFLEGPGAPLDGSSIGSATPRETVAVHRFCQCSNVLGRGDTLERLISRYTGAEPLPVAEADLCCGFGGSSSITSPEVSQRILERKLEALDESGAEVIVADNPGCILHMRAAIDARGGGPEVVHIAEILSPTRSEAISDVE